jgi:hypothetical protein
MGFCRGVQRLLMGEGERSAAPLPPPPRLLEVVLSPASRVGAPSKLTREHGAGGRTLGGSTADAALSGRRSMEGGFLRWRAVMMAQRGRPERGRLCCGLGFALFERLYACARARLDDGELGRLCVCVVRGRACAVLEERGRRRRRHRPPLPAPVPLARARRRRSSAARRPRQALTHARTVSNTNEPRDPATTAGPLLELCPCDSLSPPQSTPRSRTPITNRFSSSFREEDTERENGARARARAAGARGW